MYGVPSHLEASGIELKLLAPTSLAMGNTGTGLALHASAVYQNPAAISFLGTRGSLEVGGSFFTPTTLYLENPPSIRLTQMDTLTFSPLYGYATFRPASNGKVTLGIGVNSPYGGGSLWPEGWKGQFISQEFNFESLFVHPTFAVRLNDQWGFGMGLSAGVVTLFSRRAIDIDGLQNSRASVRFSGQGTALGLNLGLFYRPDPTLSLGLNVRTPMSVNISEGQTTFEVPLSRAEEFPPGSFSTDLTLPGEINLGVGYYAEERLLLTFDINFVLWQGWDSLKFDLDPPIENLTSYPERNWQNTTNIRGGFEYAFTDKISLRGGAFYEQSPVPNDFVSPELPDANTIGLTAGGVWKINSRLQAQLAYVYEYTGERQGVLEAANFAGLYETTAYGFMLGLGFDF